MSYLEMLVQMLVVECSGAEGGRQRLQLILHALPLLQHLLQPRLDNLLFVSKTAKACSARGLAKSPHNTPCVLRGAMCLTTTYSAGRLHPIPQLPARAGKVVCRQSSAVGRAAHRGLRPGLHLGAGG